MPPRSAIKLVNCPSFGESPDLIQTKKWESISYLAPSPDLIHSQFGHFLPSSLAPASFDGTSPPSCMAQGTWSTRGSSSRSGAFGASRPRSAKRMRSIGGLRRAPKTAAMLENVQSHWGNRGKPESPKFEILRYPKHERSILTSCWCTPESGQVHTSC